MSRWNLNGKHRLSALGKTMTKYLPRVLALTLAFALSLQLAVVAAPVAYAIEENSQPGVFVEYFNNYDRRTDYTKTPISPAPGDSAGIVEGSLQGHTGVPAEVPVSWSGISNQINAYWAKGSEVPGTNGPDMQYDGQHVVGTNYFAMRWTADLTTPDFAGDYYFKVNANDGKHFAIYNSDGTCLGEYTRWNGTIGAVNTGSNNVTGDGDTRTGFTVVDSKGDVVKIGLQANTTYRVVMEFCEHKDTAFGKLEWLYGEGETDTTATTKLGGNNTSGTAHDQYLVPDDCFSIPAELDGNLVQGYVYDEADQPVSNVTVSLGESTYTTGYNGYYRLITDAVGAQQITFTAGGYNTISQNVNVTNNTVVDAVRLQENATRYTVTFDAQGGSSVERQTVKENAAATEPEAPTLTGKVFVHWYLSTDETKSAYDFTTPITGDITLNALWRDPVSSQVTVNVTDDETAAPVSGASVTLKQGGETKDTQITNENGSAVFAAVSEGTYTVEVTAAGYMSGSGSVTTAQDGTTQTVAVSLLKEGAAQQGILLSFYDGHTTKLNLTHGPTLQQVRDDVPNFSFAWSTGTPVSGVIGTDKSAVVFETRLKVTEPGEYGFMVDTRDGGKLTIDGKVICSKEITALWQEGPHYLYLAAGFHDIQLMVYDDDANYFAHLRMLMPGETFGGNIRNEESIPISMLYLPEEMNDQVYVSGKVTDTTGAPVKGATVEIFNLGADAVKNDLHSAYTGQDGSYKILVDKGTYNYFTFSKDGYTSDAYKSDENFTLSSDLTTNGTINELTTGALALTVNGTNGTDGTYALSLGEFHQSGTFTAGQELLIEDLIPGTYTLVLKAEGYKTATRAVSISKGVMTPMTVAMEAETDGTFTGTVTNSYGHPIANATVTFSQDGQPVQAVRTGEDGTYSVTLTAGTYTITFSAFGYESSSQESTVSVLGSVTIDNQLTAMNMDGKGQLQVTVQNATGNHPGISGATVSLGSVNSATDETGLAQFAEDVGTYTLTISKDGYTTVTKEITLSENAPVNETIQLSPEVRQWAAYDINFEAPVPSGSNPYMDTAGKITATFTNGSQSITVPAFYRDNGQWTIRFSPTALGEWDYTVSYNSNTSVYYDLKTNMEDPSAAYNEAYSASFRGLTGTLTCIANPNENMHGALAVDPDNPQHFIYDDGTPTFQLGYEIDWLGLIDQGSDGIDRAKAIIDMIADAGFNQVVMNAYGWDTTWSPNYAGSNGKLPDCEGYDFGPPASIPWAFKAENLNSSTYKTSNINFNVMNEEFWAKYDEVIAYMTEKGITAHLLWKVYNKSVLWPGGQTDSSNANNTNVTPDDNMYARFFAARYQAYNVVFDISKEAWHFQEGANAGFTPDNEGKYFYLDNCLREFRAADGYDRIKTVHDQDFGKQKDNDGRYYHYLKTEQGSEANGAYTDMVQMFTDQDWGVASNAGGSWESEIYAVAMFKKLVFDQMPYFNAEPGIYQWANNGNYATFGAGKYSEEECLRNMCELVMAGAYGLYYYTNHAWDIVKYDEVPDNLDYYTRLRSFIEDTVGLEDWRTMISDDSVIGNTEWTAAKNKTNTYDGIQYPAINDYEVVGRHAMYQEGQEYLVFLGWYLGENESNKNVTAAQSAQAYKPSGEKRNVTIDIQNIVEGGLKATWYNIQTGETIDAGTVTTNGQHTFNYPTWTKTQNIAYGQAENVFLHLEPANQGETEPEVKHTVSFNANGGTGTMNPVQVAVGTRYELPACTFTAPEGMQFKAWSVNDIEQVVGTSITVTGDVTITAVWTEKPDSSDRLPGLQAYYYSDTTVDVNGDYSSLIPVTSEIINSNLNLSWGSSSPHPDLMTSDNFTVIYQGYITVPTEGEYEFKTTSNDGGLLKIDGQQVTLKTGGGGNVTGKITLTAGEHTFYLGMHEVANTASIKVEWKKPGDSALSVVPASVLTCDPLPGATVRDVISVGSLAQISVAQGTDVEDITFPAKVSVTLEGNVSATLPVSGWSSETYNPDVPGTYTFSGTLTINDYITNPTNLKATVEVKVIGTREIASVTTLHASPVLFGTQQADLPLYENVQVKLDDDTVAYVPVSSWTCETYNANQAGTYSFVGTLDIANAFIIEDTMASTPCMVSNSNNLTATLPITVMDQGQKQLVWIISDMSDPTLKGSESTGTVNDPDDVSAMAGYFLMSNEFDTRGIVISSTHRSQHATTPDQKEWADEYFGGAYADELANLNANIGGYQDELTFYQSCIKETAEHFDKNKSYADLTNYDTVQALVNEVSSLKDGEILNVLCWGSLTEPAIFVNYCMNTDNQDLLDHVRFIAHWTNSSLKQGTPEQPWKVANFNEDKNAGEYVKGLAFEGAYDYFELGCIGQHGIVSGQPRTDGYYDAFKVSELGTIFAEGKFTSNGVDHSDSATYWTLLGSYGVDLGDVDPRGNNAAKVEQANMDAYYATSKTIHEELLRRAEAAAQDTEITQYTVSFDAGEGSGTMNPVQVAVGTRYKLPACTFTAPEGMQFKAWSVNDSEQVVGTSITVTGNVTITAVWEAKPVTKYTVSVTTDGHGTASASPNSAAEGTTITLTAAANSGYHFKKWQVVIGDVTISNNQFTMPASDVTVKAVFEKDAFSGGSSGGSSSSGSTTETEKNPDGSITTTVTKPDGSTTETTKNPDGSTEVVNTDKAGNVTTTTTDKTGNKTETVEMTDGSSTTTVDNKDGSSSITSVSKDGQVEAEVKLPADVIEDAQEKGEAVTLPMPDVPVTSDQNSAPVVTVSLPDGYSARVLIPVEDVTPGTVAILINEDGSEKIIKSSLTTEDGVTATLQDGNTVKIVDNAKDFEDVSDSYWGSTFVDFATSRGLFAGTSATTFSPDLPMTRAMIVTVLAAYDGVDTTAAVGDHWYSAGQQWAMENGVSDGTNMDGNLTREQLAVMLWSYAGKPFTNGDLSSFSDGNTCNVWATQALTWCVENGLLSGTGGNMLSPQAETTRAQVATILTRYIQVTEQ